MATGSPQFHTAGKKVDALARAASLARVSLTIEIPDDEVTRAFAAAVAFEDASGT